MNEDNSKQLLRDPDIVPTDIVFEKIFDKSLYEIKKNIDQIFITTGIDIEWRYYKDGKSWLGKATSKKKTIVWISAWEKFLKASFYFTQKTRQGVFDLNINNEIKSLFAQAKMIGKIIPLTIKIKDNESLQDFNTLLNYKNKLQ